MIRSVRSRSGSFGLESSVETCELLKGPEQGWRTIERSIYLALCPTWMGMEEAGLPHGFWS